jgi:hypothetical protein
MKQLYRFSPIETKERLFEVIEYLHNNCLELVEKVYGDKLPVAGNVAVFCHFDHEYSYLSDLAESLTIKSSNPNQKYFQLKEAITHDGYKYEWLYIRKPHADSPEVGDIDFVLSHEAFLDLKSKVKSGAIQNAKVYNPTNWDMIEISSTEYDVLPYISTKAMAERARIQHSE